MPFSDASDFEVHGFQRDLWADKQSEVIGALTAANQTILGYFRAAPNITLPVPEAAVTEDMKKFECWIAAYGLLSVIGFDPGSDPDKVIKDRYTLAISWLRDVQKGAVIPFETAAETEDPDDVDTASSSAGVSSDASRYWSDLVS